MEWIQDMWLMTRDKAVRTFTAVYATLCVVALIFFAYMFLKVVVAPLGPTITFFIVLFFTIHAIEKGQAVMSIGGIILYLASFPAYRMWGIPLGMAIWTLGVCLWFWAQFISLNGPRPRHKPVPQPVVE